MTSENVQVRPQFEIFSVTAADICRVVDKGAVFNVYEDTEAGLVAPLDCQTSSIAVSTWSEDICFIISQSARVVLKCAVVEECVE